MSVNQKKLIKKYFNSLVEEFILDSAHKNITIVFKNHIDSDRSGETLGQTHCKKTGGTEHWQVINGVKIPGSEWQEPYEYTYTVYFLNNYPNKERWRGTVAHEFAHLWLYAVNEGKDHEHDDFFYSKMDYFEDWLDKKWNLSPRQDKGGDWNQHIDPSKRERRNYDPSQFHNNSLVVLNEEELTEYNRLFSLLNNSKNLSELEQNYQTVKNSSVYSSGKSKTSNQWKTVGAELNDCYNTKKKFHKLINLMENSKSLSQLNQIYQAARKNPLYASSKSVLDEKYKYLKNNLSSNDLSRGNKSSSMPLRPLLIGGVVIVGIWLILIIFSLLRPTKRKKVISK
ncbi:MAG: hypothetical protein I3270_01435 [Candidatus Moeniiplasma glomeromycotorum]|nr:hypothetical protein [Candidatus Moeniiplasma glomeromycotorum]MCE8162371.1 hypothetical protein [Candidatus Moeniiplasma glomeromycotorum]MCE8166295.1 hypothetical protein [Candidatus Moeniiplasma glomeromycotorum]MCE8166777.1 hypothetical protein [Candidatus Moeniiplasma glomeromycotorum]